MKIPLRCIVLFILFETMTCVTLYLSGCPIRSYESAMIFWVGSVMSLFLSAMITDLTK
jgi:hypothetical protein